MMEANLINTSVRAHSHTDMHTHAEQERDCTQTQVKKHKIFFIFVLSTQKYARKQANKHTCTLTPATSSFFECLGMETFLWESPQRENERKRETGRAGWQFIGIWQSLCLKALLQSLELPHSINIVFFLYSPFTSSSIHIQSNLLTSWFLSCFSLVI